MSSKKKIGNYILESKIGEGQFGQIFKSKQINSSSNVAIKVIKKSVYKSNQQLLTQLRREIKIMEKLSHPNLMRLHEFFQSSKNYYLVMDLCPEGDLQGFMTRKKISHFAEAEVLLLMTHIRKGFQQLRDLHILHRDFKLANIFVNRNKLVIGDFGTSKIFNGMTTTTVGTPVNMAPEMLKGKPYNHKSDMWSIGVVFYHLLFGEVPFYGFSIGDLLNKISNSAGEALVVPSKNPVCEMVKSVLKGLLEPNQNKRLSWDEFKNHPLFTNKHNSRCPCYKAGGRTKIMEKFSMSGGKACKSNGKGNQKSEVSRELEVSERVSLRGSSMNSTLVSNFSKNNHETSIYAFSQPAFENGIISENVNSNQFKSLKFLNSNANQSKNSRKKNQRMESLKKIAQYESTFSVQSRGPSAKKKSFGYI